MNKFQQQTTAPVVTSTPAANYSDKQFLHTFQVGLLLPLAQASVIAVMSMVGTLVILYLFDAVDFVKPMLVMGVLTWIVAFVYLMRRWLNLSALERMTGMDINGDGQIGAEKKKPSEPLVIRLDDVRNGNYRSRTMEVNATEEQLRELADGLLNGKPFTEREWTGRGKPFSSGQGGSFRALRAVWLKQGILEVVSDKDNRQGFDFSDMGWATLAKLAGLVPEAVGSRYDAPAWVKEPKDDAPDLTDEQMEAINKENAAYADKYQS
jgi:hypothetical protein